MIDTAARRDQPRDRRPAIPAQLDKEVARIIRRAHRHGLVLSREQIVFTAPDWLTIDGMDPDEWITTVGTDTE